MFDLQETDIVLSDSQTKSVSANAQRIFFDLEGGLSFRSDVLQLAYIRTDWEFNIQEVVSQYFRNAYPIEEGSFKVHGLSQEYLWEVADNYFSTELSKYPFFEDIPTMYISYCSYDIDKIKQESLKANLPEVDFGPSVSSLTLLPKSSNYFDAFILSGKKLTQSITPEIRKRMMETISALPKEVDTSRLKAHDALYDTIVLYELCRGMVK